MRRGGEAEQVGQHSYGLLRISMGVRRGAGLRSHLLTVLHAKLLPKGEEAQNVGMWGGKLPGQKQFLLRHNMWVCWAASYQVRSSFSQGTLWLDRQHVLTMHWAQQRCLGRPDGVLRDIHRWVRIDPLTQDPLMPAVVGCAPASACNKA